MTDKSGFSLPKDMGIQSQRQTEVDRRNHKRALATRHIAGLDRDPQDIETIIQALGLDQPEETLTP